MFAPHKSQGLKDPQLTQSESASVRTQKERNFSSGRVNGGKKVEFVPLGAAFGKAGDTEARQPLRAPTQSNFLPSMSTMKLLSPELEASAHEGVRLFGKWETQEVEVKDMCVCTELD